MLFWKVIIFNTKTESTRQLCFAFFLGLWLIFFSCFLVFARKKLVYSHPLPAPSPKLKYLSKISLLSAQS